MTDEAEQSRPSAHHLMPLTPLSEVLVIIESVVKKPRGPFSSNSRLALILVSSLFFSLRFSF
jgi:hypothetical protein